MEKSSALTRLVEITDSIRQHKFKDDVSKFKRSDGYYRLGAVVSYCLGRETREDEDYTFPEMLEDYAEMFKICIGSIDFVKKHSPPRALDENLKNLMRVVNIYVTEGINSSTIRLYEIKPEDAYKLQLISDNLSSNEKDLIIPSEDIESITEKISDLIRSIRESDLDLSVKDRMIQTLMTLMDGVSRINFIGPEKMLDNVDRMLGQMVQNVMTSSSEEEKAKAVGLFGKSVEIAEGAQKIVEAAKVVFPILSVMYTYAVTHLPLPPSKP